MIAIIIIFKNYCYCYYDMITVEIHKIINLNLYIHVKKCRIYNEQM